jgi:hypothetical protein
VIGSGVASALEEPEIVLEPIQTVPATLPATNDAVSDKVILIIEDLEPDDAESINPPTVVDAQDASTPSETVAPAPSKLVPVPDHSGILNTARQYALGMIETGNNDSAVGGLGEISRYQIMPSVWKNYSSSRSYRNLDVATEVARQHWASLYEYFKKKNEREPTNFDLYVLWNTRHGHYAAKGFSPGRLHPVIRDRAQRFTNLVEDSLRRESELAMANVR